MRYLFENYAFDTDRRELRRAARLVELEPRVFDVISYLIDARDRVVTRHDLLEAVWKGRLVSESALTSCINAARAALGDTGGMQRLIRTLPRKGFRFVGTVREERAAGAGTEVNSAEAASPPMRKIGNSLNSDHPSIAVLPFADMGGDVSERHLGGGIANDIITQLSRFSELFVIASNSSFLFKDRTVDVREVGRELGARYVLNGSVRRAGKRIRITALLLDAVTGQTLWAENYDRKLNDVFVIQDEVSHSIVSVLATHVRRAETQLSLSRPPATWQAYEYYLRAAETFIAFKSSFSLQHMKATRSLLTQALKIDDGYARAHALHSDTYLLAWQVPLDHEYMDPDTLQRAYDLAYTALGLDPDSCYAQAQVAAVLGYKRRFDECIAGFEKAVTLNPNYTDYRFARALVIAGKSARARQAAAAYKCSDPFYPPPVALWTGAAHYLLGSYGDALPHLQEVVSRAPGFWAGHIWCAAAYGQLGMREDARREVAEIVRVEPAFTLDTARRIGAVCRLKRDSEHYVEGLRNAGVAGP